MKRLFALSLIDASSLSHAQLWNNGEVANGVGLSVVSPSSTWGWGAQTNSFNSVADNFSVGAGLAWNVTSLDFFAYQTGATSFPLTNVTWSVVKGDVNSGSVVASGTTNATDGGLMGYRVTTTTLTNTQRGIYRAQADVTDFSLTEGNYWLRWSFVGAAGLAGPWQPSTSTGDVGNAMQAPNGGAYAAALDSGTGLGVEMPFLIYGDAMPAVPEPSTFALMLMGGLGVVLATRRRKQAR